MILVDTSVFIDWFRDERNEKVRFLEETSKPEEILLADVVLLELLQGARDDIHAAKIQRSLSHFRNVEILSWDMAIKAARNFRSLRSLGITIRKSNDLLIGTYCIENSHMLLHSDRDFHPIAEHLGLQEF
jgi:predicted nucleic acid-binding protein